MAYLLLAPSGRFQRRDRVVGLLWPELDQSHARGALRKAMHLVRECLGSESVVTRGDEELAVPADAIWCDAVELQRAAAAGQLARAIELYRGDLLPGFHLAECNDFESWLEEQRHAVLEQTVAAAQALATTLETTHQKTEAGRMAEYAARLAWHNERVLRRSIVMLDRLGDRAGALRLYERIAKRMRTELETEPSAETKALVDSLRAT